MRGLHAPRECLGFSARAGGQSLACGAGSLGRCYAGQECLLAAQMPTGSNAAEGTRLAGAPWVYASSAPEHSTVSWYPKTWPMQCLRLQCQMRMRWLMMHLSLQWVMHALQQGCNASLWGGGVHCRPEGVCICGTIRISAAPVALQHVQLQQTILRLTPHTVPRQSLLPCGVGLRMLMPPV